MADDNSNVANDNSTDGNAPVQADGLSGNAPKAADFSDTQSNVPVNGDPNLNPAQPANPAEYPAQSQNNTRPYGSDANDNAKKAVGKDESIHSVAERDVVERNGESIRNNPKFKELVASAEKQIQANIDNTKGM